MNVKCRKCGLYNNSQQEAQCRRCGFPIEEVYSSSVTRMNLDNHDAPKEAFSFFNSKGRISRLTYWMFYLFLMGVYIILGVLMKLASLPESDSGFIGILILPLAGIGILMQIKRWHDRDKSGWWVLINFIPVIGPFWTLIECGLLKGTDGANRFGSDPLG